jgi:hypothetical protein
MLYAAVTGLTVTSATAPAIAAVQAFAAGGNEPAPEANKGASPPSPPTASGPPETEITKSTHIGVQVSNALLGLTVTSSSNSATAPDAVQPAPQSTTAMADFAIDDAAQSQPAGNDSAGSGTDDSEAFGNSHNSAGKSAAQFAASQGSSSAGANGKTDSTAALPPLPVIPQWHIRPRTKIA